MSFGIDVLEDGPAEAGEFSGDGNDGNLGSATLLDPAKVLVESELSLPAMGYDVKGKSLLALAESGAHAWGVSVTPGGLDEDVAAVRVAGFGDRVSSFATAGGVFAGEAQTRLPRKLHMKPGRLRIS